MAKAKRKSGGARAVAKKRAEREAARKRTGNTKSDWLAIVDGLGPTPKDPRQMHDWLARAAVAVVRSTLRDVAVPPEQMRRDAMKQIEQASKVLDPAKLSVEIDELERALEELRKHAGHVETGETRPPSKGTPLQ